MRWIDEYNKPSNVIVFKAASVEEAALQADQIFTQTKAQAAVWRSGQVSLANPQDLALIEPGTQTDTAKYYSTGYPENDWSHPALSANRRVDNRGALLKVFTEVSLKVRLEKSNVEKKHVDMAFTSKYRSPDLSKKFKGRHVRITVTEAGATPESNTWIYDPAELADGAYQEILASVYNEDGSPKIEKTFINNMPGSKLVVNSLLQAQPAWEPWATHPGDWVFMTYHGEPEGLLPHSAPEFTRDSFEEGRVLVIYDCIP